MFVGMHVLDKLEYLLDRWKSDCHASKGRHRTLFWESKQVKLLSLTLACLPPTSKPYLSHLQRLGDHQVAFTFPPPVVMYLCIIACTSGDFLGLTEAHKIAMAEWEHSPWRCVFMVFWLGTWAWSPHGTEWNTKKLVVVQTRVKRVDLVVDIREVVINILSSMSTFGLRQG